MAEILTQVLGFQTIFILSEIQSFCPIWIFKSSYFRQKKVSEIQTFLFRFQTLPEIQTVRKWDKAELYEIQTSSDFRHSLYCVLQSDAELKQLLRFVLTWRQNNRKNFKHFENTSSNWIICKSSIIISS